MKKQASALLALGMTAALASESVNDFKYEMEISKQPKRSTELTNKQKKVRVKNKLAKRSRKNNRKN
jgi:uncharacterized protein YdcH (DUF465 family)